MKIIVIAGAKSKIGKTTTLRTVKSFLEESVAVKLGKKGETNKNKPEMLLDYEATLEDILRAVGYEPSYLLIEGNSILHKIIPNLSIFVDAEGPGRKPYADDDMKVCDLVVGQNTSSKKAAELALKINMDLETFQSLLHGLNIQIK